MRHIPAALSRDQWIIFFGWLTWGLGNGLWFHLQPLYIEHLGADIKQVGAALGLSGLVVTFLYIPVGLLADRWRRRPLILAGWVAGTLAMAGVAFAPDWRWAIPGFSLYWLASFSRPAVAGAIAASDRGGNVSRSFAILSTAFLVGEVISPGIGGWVGERWGLRSVFFVALGFYVLSTLVMLRLGADPPRVRAHSGQIRALVTDRAFLQQMVVFMLALFALDLGVVLAPNYLVEVKGLSIQQIGQLGTAAALGRLALMFTFGQLRAEGRLGLLLNQACVVLALLLLLNAPAGVVGGLPMLAFFLAYFLRGGDRAVHPLMRGRLSLVLSPAIFSLGFSFFDTIRRIAETASPFLAGQLYARSPALPLMAGMACLVGTMLLTLALPQVRPAAAELSAPTVPSGR